MNTFFKLLALPTFLALSSGTLLDAQDKPPASARGPIVTLKVDLVISRFQGEKKISSVPYTMSVTASEDRNELGRLRIGAQLPIPTQTPPTPPEGKPAPPSSAVQYRDVGTSIDCQTRSVGEGRFQLLITIDQTSVLMEGQSNSRASSATAAPVFRSFRLTNSAVLRDGQTTQFSTATDAVSGEVVRVDVTVNVMK